MLDIPKSTLLYDINSFLFNDRGCKMTSYVCLKGGYETDMGYTYHWLSEIDDDYRYSEVLQRVFPNDGYQSNFFPTSCHGIRPTINYEFLINNGEVLVEGKKYISNDFQDLEYNGERSYSIYQYGEYPQVMVDYEKNKKLEELYKSGELKLTDKLYFYAPGEFDTEYEYEGKRYVRAKVLNDTLRKNLRKEYLWVEVKPIKWFVDIDAKIAISEKIIAGPLQYNKVAKESIDKTYIGNFLEHYLSKDIVVNKNYSNSTNKIVSNELELNEWINWSNENNIHPLIYMFMINTNGKYLSEDNNWKEISDKLYETKDIESLKEALNINIYDELNELYQSINIKIEDVLNNTVDLTKIKKLNIVNKYLLITLLTLIDEEDYEIVCEFIKNNLGKKYLKYYDSIYKQSTQKKMKK